MQRGLNELISGKYLIVLGMEQANGAFWPFLPAYGPCQVSQVNCAEAPYKIQCGYILEYDELHTNDFILSVLLGRNREHSNPNVSYFVGTKCVTSYV